MTKIIKAAALVTGLFLSAHVAAVPVQWTSGVGANGHWYEFVTGAYDNAGAHADAATKNHLGLTGYLATISSAEENSFVTGLNTVLAWISGSDATTEGTFVFTSGPEIGAAMTYFNWASSEPNNSGNEDAIHMNLHGPGLWNDFPAHGAHGYLVEYSASAAVSEPTTFLLYGLGLIALGLRRQRKLG